MMAHDVNRIAVIGAGLMGHGIAQEFALAGYTVALQDIDGERLQQVPGAIRANLDLLVSLGLATAEHTRAVPESIALSTDLAVVVRDADLVVEAAPEDLTLKQGLFAELDRLCPPHTILASNSSSYLPSSYAAVTARPDRVLGTHYFNPPYLVPLVEVIRHDATSQQTVATMVDLLSRLGKRPIVLQKEAPGFVANRLQMALLREALWLVRNGIATPREVDAAITGSIGRRWAVAGIFELFDLAGWDIVAAASEAMMPSLDSSADMLADLREWVERGDLGAKAGRGVYEWTPDEVARVRERLGRAMAALARLA
jgi:3-hydroxybutyryl-CoA dehydrogenase